MPIVNVTLEDILRARDTRANAQRRLLRAYRLPLVSFTMNIAGPVKDTPLVRLAFRAGLAARPSISCRPQDPGRLQVAGRIKGRHHRHSGA